MKYAIVIAGVLVSFLSTGCMSGYYAHRERRQMAVRDSLQTPPMTVDDVIALARDSVADDVIINQIKATHSYFQLTTNDILDLKKSGVSGAVINTMIKTGNEPRVTNKQASYSTGYYNPYPYPDYFWDPYPPYYYYPWYPSVYLGFSYRGGYFPGYRFGGHGFPGGYRGGHVVVRSRR